MLRQIRKSMNLTLTFMLAVPAFILVLFSIINVDYMYVAGILSLIFFVAFFCIFLVQKRKYNKVSKVIEKYMAHTLENGENSCGGEHHHCHGHHHEHGHHCYNH